MKRLWIACFLFLTSLFWGPPMAADNAAKSYPARGVVEKIAPNKRRVTIHHQAIPGYMMEMTMDFTVKDTNNLAGISPGDEIQFKLIVQGDNDWIEDIRRLGRGTLEAAKPVAEASTEDKGLAPGDMLPDDELLTEAGQSIRFSNFRGQALAFTFFFTRCPLPDFCPRMNRNLSEARQLILSTAGAPTNWVLMSVSFDAAFDTPKVLSNYATLYRGSDTSHWLFTSAPAATLADLAPRLDLVVVHVGGGISHSLVTVVLDTGGRIFREFDGNDWTPRQLADALLEAAQPPATPTPTQK